MKRNRLMYAVPLACLLATGAFTRLAVADDAQAADSGYGSGMGSTSKDSTYGTSSSDRATNADPSRPNDNTLPDSSQTGRHSSSSTSGSTMKDAAITAKVKSALMAERDLPSSQIGVETNNGVVQLSGFLGSQTEIDRAVSIARNVKDVKSVENNMQTK
jgi:osmotically-inducible protein OsmY